MGCGAGWERLQAVSPQVPRDAQQHRIRVCAAAYPSRLRSGTGFQFVMCFVWQTKAGSLCHIKLLEKPRFAGNEGR